MEWGMLAILVLLLAVFVVAEEVPFLPITVEIQSTEFEYDTRELSLNTTIYNNNEVFLSNLKYKLELYGGDALGEDGMIFLPLEYTLTRTGEVPEIEPNGAIEFTVSIIPPVNLESGNYFIRFMIDNDEKIAYGIDYTRNPVFLTGQGGFLPSPNGYFRSSHGDDYLSSGWYLEPEEAPSIILPEEQNEKLFTQVDGGEELYFYAVISRLNLDREVVRTDSYKTIEATSDETFGRIIEYDLGKGETIGPGPFDVTVFLVNSKDVPVSEPIHARWLVHGFFARLHEIKSGESVYEKGQLLDLNVGVVNWSYDFQETGKIDLILETEEGQITLSEDVSFVDNETKNISFSDYVFDERTIIKSAKVFLYAEGEQMDEAIFEFAEVSVETPPVSIPETGQEEDVGEEDNSGVTILVVGIIIGLAIIGFGVFKMKKKKKPVANKSFTVSLILLVLIVVVVIIFSPSVYAGCRSSSASVWFSSHPPSNVICGQSVSATAYAAMSCGTCMNGVTGTLTIDPAGSCGLGDQGHNWDYLQWGPCTKSWVVGSSTTTVNQSSSYSASVQFYEGCHCCGSSASTGGGTVYCIPPNKPPVIDTLVITNVNNSGLINNHFGTAADPYESVICSGQAHDPDPANEAKGLIKSYNFSLWTKNGSIKQQMDASKYSRGGTTNSNSVTGSETFEISDGIPVGTEIYCKATVTDGQGASVTASTK